MSTDLVAELRRAVEQDPDPIRDTGLMRRAADEIERLTRIVKRNDELTATLDAANKPFVDSLLRQAGLSNAADLTGEAK